MERPPSLLKASVAILLLLLLLLMMMLMGALLRSCTAKVAACQKNEEEAEEVTYDAHDPPVCRNPDVLTTIFLPSSSAGDDNAGDGDTNGSFAALELPKCCFLSDS